MTVLRTIFARSNLRPPADARELGPPLYAYQVTEAELQELRSEVAWDIRRRVRMKGSPAGAFCLFAAEHLCRSYAGGSWRWSSVFDALSADPNQPERDRWVRAGMAYWRRPIVQTDTQQRLLTSLVCEGGLPLHLLAEGRDRYLKDFFRTLIREAERLQVPAAQVVGRAAEVLPQTLQNETVAGLGSMLADAVIGLRRGLPDGSTEDPFAVLSRVMPDWRRLVPLRVDAGAFGELLRGLLREARATAVGDNPVEITAVLLGPPFRIERRAAIAQRCSVAALARLLGVPAPRLVDHNRITLSLLASNGERPVVAIARLSTDQARYTLETLPGVAIRHDGSTQAAVRLVASVGGKELACVEPTGGGPLLADQPWVFDGGERPVRLLRRQGAYRTAASELRLAVPPLATVSSEPAARRLGEVAGRPLLAIEGPAAVTGTDETWQVCAASSDEDEAVYELSGTLGRTGFGGSEYWRGLPRVMMVRAGGVRIEVPQHDLQVRAAGQPLWRAANTVWGDIQVRSNHEANRFRTRMVALPPDMQVRVDAARGIVTLQSEVLKAVVYAGARYESTQGACAVPVARDVSTSTVALEVEFRAGSATLHVPAPVRRARFVGRDGETASATVLDRLGQVRAIVVSPDPGDEFGLEARIFGHVAWTEIVQVPAAVAQTGVWELALDSIRDHVTNLLAISYHLDEEVELRVTSHGRSLADVPVLRVRRYEVKPQVAVDAEAVTVTFSPRELSLLGARGLERLKLELRPITAPDASAAFFERAAAETPTWRAKAADLAEHPTWLLIGRIGERVRLRPVLVGGGATTVGLGRLEEALVDSNKVRRRETLRAILGEIATEWERPEWETVSSFLSTLGTMPATTFDVVDIASELPVVAASALFRCAGSDAGLQRIWRGFDELPFLWENVPLDAWLTAARALARYVRLCSAQFDVQEQVLTDALLAPHLKHGPTLSKFFETIHAVLYRCVAHCPPPPNDQIAVCRHPHAMPILESILNEQVQEMLRRHEGDWWPTKLAIVDEKGRDIPGNAGISKRFASHCHEVIDVPLKAGIAAGSNLRLSPSSLLSLRRVRTFDPTWFEFAHAVGFTLAAASVVPERS